MSFRTKIIALMIATGASAASVGPSHAAQTNCQTSEPSSAHEQPTLAEKLGALIAKSRFEDLSPEVVERTKLTILDNLATIAYTAQLTRNDPYRHRLRARGGAKEALLLGTGLRLPVEDAAAASAWLIHAAETDDSDFRASLRASPVVMGPALAMAARERVSGKDFLLSLANGYTVLGRLAEPLGPLQLRGYMSSGVWGPSASAAVSAKLLRLDGAQTGNAIAIAAGASGGSFQYFYDQTEEKKLVVARAARAGAEAAVLACNGETGARRIFEGQAGIYRLFGGDSFTVDQERLLAGYSQLEGPLRLYPKFFAASASIIPFLEAMPAERIDANEVDRFVLRGNEDAARIYRDKIEHYVPPNTPIGAKTNLGFVLALFLIRGSADPFDFEPSALADPSINRLAASGSFELSADSATTLEIILKDGRVMRIVPLRSDGSKTEPVMLDARLKKFRSLTRDVLSDADRAILYDAVMTIEAETDMRRWLKLVDKVLTESSNPIGALDGR